MTSMKRLGPFSEMTLSRSLLLLHNRYLNIRTISYNIAEKLLDKSNDFSAG